MTQTALKFLYAHSPSLFAKEQLFLDVDSKQVEYLDTKAEEVLLLWCRQSGKTTSSAAKAVHHTSFQEDALALIASASQKQAAILQTRALNMIRKMNRKNDWRKKDEVYGRETNPLTGETELVRQAVMSLQMANGSEIISVPASPETVRGYSPTLIILDEAAWMGDEVYIAIRPMRAVTHAQLVCSSSAGMQMGWFYDAWHANDDPTVHKIEVLAKDCPRITPEFLKQEQMKIPETMYRREYLNEFLAPEGGLFTEEDIKGMELDDMGLEAIARPWVPDDLSVDVYE